jgi:L-ascorbate metabolism protein UlaG (beta-lactamase superfamily)
MGRFDDLATKPARGPRDLLKWKLGSMGKKDLSGWKTPTREPDRALIDGGSAQITWIGHASFLLTLGGKRILIDPIFSTRLGTVSRLAPPGIAAAALPPIDVVLITHNHRDHLDPRSLALLGPAPTYIVPSGDLGLVKKTGAQKVIEAEWWRSIDLGSIEITFVPSRHWSMHYPWDRNESLWGGYVIRSNDGAAYHSGDTGFFDGFEEIGKRLGAIDWAMLPIGAYEPRWFMEPQHMGPEEAVEALRMLDAKRLVAMHWGTFKLTDEPAGEPPERARAAFAKANDPGKELWIFDVGETRPLAR